MPDSTVFDYYVANGTAISYSDLPGGSINELLSPASNPYGLGETNAEGIYVIDCLGQVILVGNCRIVGTLVLLNAGAGSNIGNWGKLNWAPAVGNYPVLLVQCSDIYFSSGEGTLNESQVGNMNPSGTPYQGGTDSDATDEYPAIIKGLVYVTGGIRPESAGKLVGVMIAGADIAPFSATILNYQSTFLDNPPPGFEASATMKISPGSWQKNVD